MKKPHLPTHIAEDLGTLDPIWRGWKIRRGQLFDPESNATLGWTPSQVRAMRYWRQQLEAMQAELQRARTETHDLELLIGEHGPAEAARKRERRRKREPRQLSNLSRQGPTGFTQAPEAHSHSAPLAFSFSVPWRAGLPAMPVRAIPPATQRDRK